MNRLIIIGNGFDLAHGLKTSYEDFVLNIFKLSLLHFIDNGYPISNQYELFTITKLNNFHRTKVLQEIDEIDSLELFLEHSEINVIKFSDLNKRKTLAVDTRAFEFKIHSRFFSELIIDKNWTDIENIYYRLLIQEFKNPTLGHSNLNDEFQIINDLLIKFIEQINVGIPKGTILNTLDPLIKRLFDAKGQDLKNICFVNFNYTDLVQKYIGYSHQPPHNLLSIHGTVSDPESIIFGYGDDTEEHYKSLENSLDDEYLKNIKSFKYKLSDNYDKIIGFLEMDFFEVYIVGHSMGVSDRVLLKTIFEHKRCHQIRLFHRGSKASYFKRCISISRHFDNKIAMRQKIISYEAKDIIN